MIGTRSRSAVSWMRTIFSTVRGPQEPALTVGSLAITQTGRPSIRPIAVTTPSAPYPGSSLCASSARRKGTAADAADRSFEQTDTGLQRREHVGEGGAARVVEMRAPTHRRQALLHLLKECFDLRRIRNADGVGQRNFFDLVLSQCVSDLGNPLGRHPALIGATKRDTDAGVHDDTVVACLGRDRLDLPERVFDSSVEVVLVVAIGGRDRDRH